MVHGVLMEDFCRREVQVPFYNRHSGYLNVYAACHKIGILLMSSVIQTQVITLNVVFLQISDTKAVAGVKCYL